jgi:hypothetical protein
MAPDAEMISIAQPSFPSSAIEISKSQYLPDKSTLTLAIPKFPFCAHGLRLHLRYPHKQSLRHSPSPPSLKQRLTLGRLRHHRRRCVCRLLFGKLYIPSTGPA